MMETATLQKRTVRSPRAAFQLCVTAITAAAAILSVTVPLLINQSSAILPALAGTVFVALIGLLMTYLFVTADFCTGRVIEVRYPGDCTTLELECFEDVGDGWFSGPHLELHVQVDCLAHAPLAPQNDQPFWNVHAEPSCVSPDLRGTHRCVSVYDDRPVHIRVGDVVSYRRTGLGETLEIIARAAA